MSTPSPPQPALGGGSRHFADRWRRLFGDQGHTQYVRENAAAEDELAVVWVDGRERLLCCSTRGLIALVRLQPGCSFDEAREALQEHGALVDSRERDTPCSGVTPRRGPVTSLWRLAGRVEILGRLHPQYAEVTASIQRVMVGEGTELDRDRVVAAIERTRGDDDVGSAIIMLASVALLVDDGESFATAWFGEASRSLTRAGVP